MQLECQNCHQLLNLADSKLPVGRPFSFNCPFCKHKNISTIPAKPEPRVEAENENAAPPSPDVSEPRPSGLLPDDSPPSGSPPDDSQPSGSTPDAGGGQAADSQADRKISTPAGPDFTFNDPGIQSLIMGGIDDRPKALVVYDDDEVAAMLAEKLEALGYSASVAVNLRDAAKQLKFTTFAILIVQEDYYGASFQSNHLLKTVISLDSHTRRSMLAILISPTMTTLDDLLAFSLSLDAVINVSELEAIDRILMSIIARGKKFYAIYREILAEHGLD